MSVNVPLNELHNGIHSILFDVAQVDASYCDHVAVHAPFGRPLVAQNPIVSISWISSVADNVKRVIESIRLAIGVVVKTRPA